MQTPPVTQDEMISTKDLKIKFFRVLEDMSIVNGKTKNLETEAEYLLTKLENLRNSEKDFTNYNPRSGFINYYLTKDLNTVPVFIL